MLFFMSEKSPVCFSRKHFDALSSQKLTKTAMWRKRRTCVQSYCAAVTTTIRLRFEFFTIFRHRKNVDDVVFWYASHLWSNRCFNGRKKAVRDFMRTDLATFDYLLTIWRQLERLCQFLLWIVARLYRIAVES